MNIISQINIANKYNYLESVPNKVPTDIPAYKTPMGLSFEQSKGLKSKYISYPAFKSNNLIKKYSLYSENYKLERENKDEEIIKKFQELKHNNGNAPFKKYSDAEKLYEGLRETKSVREFQLNMINYLMTHPKFENANDITKFISQINTVERGALFLSQTKKYTKKYPQLTAKELVAIIPRLEDKNKLDMQEKFIDQIYMHPKSRTRVPLDTFSELLSTVNDEDIADLQLDFYTKLMNRKNMTPTIAINLITNIEDVENGELKEETALKLLQKGINAEDLPILIPKVKNNSVAKLQNKMADYFIEKKGMKSDIASKIMSNIQEPQVFHLQKNIIEDITKLREFEGIDILKILGDIQTPEMAELKDTSIKELAKIKKLDGHDIMHIVTNVDNIYGAEIKVKTAKKLAEIESLNGNNIGYIVAGCHNEESSRVKCRACKELSDIKGMDGSAITTIASRLLKDETANIQIEAVKELINENVFSPKEISKIVLEIRNIDFKNAKFKAKDELLKNEKLTPEAIVKILLKINGESKDKYLMSCIQKMSQNETFSKDDITNIATTMNINKHTCNDFIDYFVSIPAEVRKDIKDYSVIQDFSKFRNKSYLNHFDRRELLGALIKHNSSIFEGQKNDVVHKLYNFLPKNSDEYCQLIPILAKSIYKPYYAGNVVRMNATSDYYKNINKITSPDSSFLKLDLEDPKNKPRLKYRREKFIGDINNTIKNFSAEDKEKITDIFNFILGEENEKITMKGYPQSPKKINLSTFNQEQIDAIINIDKYVRRFNEYNEIIIPNSSIEVNKQFNTICKAFPELYTLVEKPQNSWHVFDTFTHTLRVLQEVAKNERFQKLNPKDQIILSTAALFHDISKEELKVDKSHSLTGALDTYQISQRLNFSETDRNKLFAIIRNHEWLKYYNKEGVSELQKIERAKTVAFSLREGNAFDLVSILSEADLKGMQKNDASYNLFKDAQKEGNSEVARYVRDLQRTAIHLPQYRIPEASSLKPDGRVVREANIGGIKNKVIYLYKNMGKGSLPFDKELDPNDFNVLVHALDSEKNSLIFQRMDEVDSDTLISASYVNLAKGNWKAFRQQGFILNVDSDNIHAAYFKDFGSGLSKNIDRLKLDYLFEGYFKPQRDYISQKIKEKLHISDESYKSLYQDIKNKTLPEIRKEYPFVSAAIKQIYMEMQGGEYTYGRNYNEVLVTRPKIQGVFAYDRSITQVPKYLRKYAEQADIPVIIFMD